jgi:hypothetical protein
MGVRSVLTWAAGTTQRNACLPRIVSNGMPKASKRITEQVGSWDGVTFRSHRYGGVEFRLGRVELGHIHGDHLADLPFPKAMRDELLSAGRAEAHHVLPDTGWVSRRIGSDADVEDVIGLFRLNYERVAGRRKKSPSESGSP